MAVIHSWIDPFLSRDYFDPLITAPSFLNLNHFLTHCRYDTDGYELLYVTPLI